MIYLTRFVHSKSIKTLSLHYDELMRKNKEYEGKKYLKVEDCMMDKVLHIIKEIIGIEEFGNTKILVDTDDKLPDNINFKNVVILITCIIEDDGKFYPYLFLEEALFFK